MHRICVDDARRRRRLKRGGGIVACELEEEPVSFDRDPIEVLAIDEALTRLGQESPELAELVRLRYFVGLNLDETAEVMGVARRTVVNQWRIARAWLHAALSDGEGDSTTKLSKNGDGSVETD
jgi:RNA polymerase sigma factor (TIGR02999 family)